jgi:D-amino-acid dehydrogenase
MRALISEFTAGAVAEVLREGLRIASDLKDASLTEIRVGFRPLSKDGLPLLGWLPSASGVVIATSVGPYGLTVGPYFGALAARLAVGDTPAHGLSEFEPNRSIG